MRLVRTIAAARKAVAQAKRPLGLVPTMGFLHEGHLALVRRARAENEALAVSIFVNPTQFGPSEDFADYPRDLERDLDLLRKEKVDFVFAPAAEEVYPAGFSTGVLVEGLTERLEGEFRPGHFRGVATVVLKLLNILQPDRAYFGQKDAQQLRVIRQMVSDLNLPVEVVAVPTVREKDGLALSSRNVRLSPEARQSATVLSRALRRAEDLYEAGERSGWVLREAMRSVLAEEPSAKADYVSVADPETLQELETVTSGALLSLAVRIGGVRLIDNLPLP
ncbi:MAG TPA: pantoate--beta-alanine ligase [Chloroflexota bacterium]|nr:pantoate--beta-alanine ligase [Chloroflexota bacterium]